MDTPDFTTTTASTATTTPPPDIPTTTMATNFFRANTVQMNDNNSREWNTVVCNVKGFDMNIQMKSRLTEYQSTMDDSLYQPIVYQFFHSFSSPSLPQILQQTKGIVTLKLQVLKYCNEQQAFIPVKHHQQPDQTIVSGQADMTIQASNNNKLSAVQKVQFTDSSFHHDRKPFVIQVSYFAPLVSEKEPILVKQSAEFRIFARKPQTTTTSNGKTTRAASPPANDGQLENATPKKTGQKRKLDQYQEDEVEQNQSPPQPVQPVENEKQYRMHLDRQGQQDGLTGSVTLPTVSTTASAAVVATSPTEEHSLPFKFRKTVKQSHVQMSTSTTTSSSSPTPSSPKIQNMVEFKETLQDLLEYHEHLESNTKRVLMDIVVRSVLKLDPQYSKQLLVKYLSSALGTNTDAPSVPHSDNPPVNNSIK